MKNEHLIELAEAARAIGALAQDDGAFGQAVKAFDSGDREAFRRALEQRGLLPHCRRICFWLCIWRCVRVARLICVNVPTAPPTPGEIVELSRLLQPLRENAGLLKRLIDAMDRSDAQTLTAIVTELKLQRFCFFVFLWICHLRCRRFCVTICTGPREVPLEEPLTEIGNWLEGLAAVARDEATLTKAQDAVLKQDVKSFHAVLQGVGVLRLCIILCRWFCYWNCVRICFIVCREIPRVDLEIPQLREFALALARLGTDEKALTRVNEALVREDRQAWDTIIGELKLSRFCYYVCQWICYTRCELYCWFFCPPGCQTTFRYIGDYNILTDIDAGTGLTNDTRAFFSTIKLRGVMCKQHSGGPAEYRFEYMEHPAGAWTAVPTDWIVRTEIGQWQSTVPAPPDDVKPYAVKGTAPDDKVATLTGTGWIQVPQESNVNDAGGNFAPNGDLLLLDTEKMATWTSIAITATAGQSTTPPPLGVDKLFGLRLRVRRVGMPATEVTAGTCGKVAIYNTHYDNVTHKGAWAPEVVDDQLGVVMVNVEEIGAGCAKITNTLTIKYTAAHPNLGPIEIHMDGPGGPYPATPVDDPAATDFDKFGTASVAVNVANLDKCAYVVKLKATILLTTGESTPDDIRDEVAFCK